MTPTIIHSVRTTPSGIRVRFIATEAHGVGCSRRRYQSRIWKVYAYRAPDGFTLALSCGHWMFSLYFT